MSDLDLDTALELLPSSSYGAKSENPIVYMARTALHNGADPKAIIESLIVALVDENNRSRPSDESASHTHHHWSNPGNRWPY